MSARAYEEDDSQEIGVLLDEHAPLDGPSFDLTAALRGVQVPWLAQAFHLHLSVVRRRLSRCPELRREGNRPVYDLAVAASYLCEPRVDVAAWIASLRPADLPPQLQDAFWSAAIKRQKWELQAGDLWATEDVLEVLGDVFQLVKNTVMLWVDAIARAGSDTGAALTLEQREVLVKLTDGLQAELYRALVEMPSRKKTGNRLVQSEAEGE